MPSFDFTSEWSRVRVVAGPGAVAHLPAELDALSIRRALIVTTPGRARALPAVRVALGDRAAGICDLAALHVPIERVSQAVSEVDRTGPDAFIAVGGGSAIGLAKAIALERPRPIVAVPTTYSGSEMTSIWGVTEGDLKRTGRNALVAPRLVIYDAVLTVSLPVGASAASGMNAIAHAVEATYGPHAGPIALAAADAALRILARALPVIVTRPADLDARGLAFQGAHAAGVSLELAAMGLHHKICHVLGGTFGLPHAETHAALLPHVVAFTAPAAPEAMARIAGALGAASAAAGLRRLNEQLGLTATLGSLGLRPADVPRAAQLVASAPYANPRLASEEDIRCLLSEALAS
jgi:maleylacetate reductase